MAAETESLDAELLKDLQQKGERQHHPKGGDLPTRRPPTNDSSPKTESQEMHHPRTSRKSKVESLPNDATLKGNDE